jgi:O-antigen/teichoic acid export membrane protein
MVRPRWWDPADRLGALRGALGVQVAGYGIALAVPMGISFLSVPVFTRLVSIEDYGRYSLVTAVVALLVTLGTGWSEYAVVRILPEQRSTHGTRAVMRSLLPLTLLPAGIASVVILAIGGIGARLGWLSPDFVPFVLPSALILAARPVYQVLRGAFQALGAAHRYGAYEVVQSTLAFGIGVWLVGWQGLGMPGRLWGEVAVLAVLAVVAGRAHWIGSGEPHRPDVPTSREVGRRALRFGLPAVSWSVGFNLMGVIERGLLRLHVGDEAVGAYGAVYAIVDRSGTLAFAPLLMATFPVLVRLWSSQGAATAGLELGRAASRYAVVACLFLGLGLAFGKTIAELVLPGTYRAGIDVIPWLLGALVIWHFAMYAHKGLEVGERLWTMALAMAVAVGGLALAGSYLVPRLGILGAAFARLFASGVYLLAVWGPSRRLIPWHFSRGWRLWNG